jgi:hypothetical protein
VPNPNLYLLNYKCLVAKLGAAAASILLQNLELQGFFRKRQRKRQSEKDNER